MSLTAGGLRVFDSLDPEEVRDIALSVARDDRTWAMTPEWNAASARHRPERRLVAWTPRVAFEFPLVEGVVADQFDGRTTLGELVDDLVAVFGIPVETAEAYVAHAVVLTCAIGACDIELSDLIGAGDETRPDSVLGEAAELLADLAGEDFSGDRVTFSTADGSEVTRTVDAAGNLLTFTVHPDGTRTVSTSVVIGADDVGGSRLYDDLLDGGRSLAELAPPDSCVGSKLRNLNSVPLLSFIGADGRTRSVRCHDPDVETILLDRLGGGGGRIEPGPILAFVVTPLEGRGPLRVYDGSARRRGRPRTPDDAAAIVADILGEDELIRSGGSADASLVLPWILGTWPGGVVLLPFDAVDDSSIQRWFRTAGGRLGSGCVMLRPDGSLCTATTTAPVTTYEPTRVSFALRGDTGETDLFLGLLPEGLPGGQHLDRVLVVDRLVDLMQRTGRVTLSEFADSAIRRAPQKVVFG